MKTTEWTEVYQPFNSAKHFSQIYRWSEVGKTPPPAPASISLDPSNLCQLDCVWCNSSHIKGLNPKMISQEVLRDIAFSLPYFTDHPRYGHVEAVCVAGGGEPLMNPYTQDFIELASGEGVKVGLITNGILLNEFDVVNCDWLGVSVDAGRRETYKELKGSDQFHKVIRNIEDAVNTPGRLNKPGRAHGVNYKFVMYPKNIEDIHEATIIAKATGCRSIHIRPYAIPFKNQGIPFSPKEIVLFREQLDKARTLETDDFKVYGITHKYGEQFETDNNFKTCKAILFSATIEPPTDEGFDVSLCCDRRGDPLLKLPNTNLDELKQFWGSEYHLSLVDKIDPKSCPRCTRGPHNKTYEGAVAQENMSHEFG